MKRGGRDFRTGESIDVHAYFDDAIDIHHIFPQRWCRENGIEDGLMNCVVNKTAIDAHTNRRIGGNAPSRYIARLEAQDGIDHAEFDAILQSHDIDPIALRQDDFPQFFDRRFERLLKQIEEAMGKSVNRSADRADNPYSELHDDAGRVQAGVESLISGGESKVVEFKSTGRRNLRTNEKDAAIEWAVVKSIAGFMNAHGGTLLVGVSDDEQIVGIERDYAFLRKGDRDGWELWFTGLIASALGKVAASELEVSFADVDGGTVARIDVGPASKPVFAMPSKGERKEQFLVRINNSTQELLGRDALDYQQKRWPS